MNYIIQNIIFPNYEVCDEEQMYFRKHGHVVLENDGLKLDEYASCDFSTYFNSFSLNKWLEYTKLSNLKLTISIKGTFIIEIYSASWFHEEAIHECIGRYTVHADQKKAYQFPVDISKNSSIYFKIQAINQSGSIYNGYYSTEIDKEMLNLVNIDLVMCTFKREKYVTRNIDLIVNDFIKNKNYNGANHFKVKVVDNGKTLPVEKMEIPGIVQVFPNLNVGGSGGFCRGMIESLHDNTSTHILFMDDDVLVQVEAFEKTYNFLTLLKDDYKNEFLGGAMLRLDQKNVQHENLAGFKGNHLIGLKQNLNLNKYKNVLFNEKEEQIANIYCAWWYCCIPKSVATLENLPYPFFIRMDDIEYSIRNIRQGISLNGIAVWHEAFDKKYSTLMENYFMFRNNLVVNCIHHTGNKKMALKFLLRRFAHDIFRYDYNGAELLLEGVENFLKGPDFFKTVDTVKDLKKHGSKQVKTKPIGEITDIDMLYEQYCVDLNKSKESHLTKLIRFATLNGHLVPSFFFHSNGFAEYGYGNNSKMYFLKKNVIACDSNFERAIVLSIRRKKAFRLFLRWLKVSLRLNADYNRLEKEYKSTFYDMTSESFWIKYLKI
jgi:galactofuranosylgalactofuranosylrhamnosyl-N-acetylglucosaminyl-diphospho-decaprenol beta-1,5/1,6-galactofuranosyltransferase